MMGNPAEAMPQPAPQEGFTPEEEAWFNKPSVQEAVAKRKLEAAKAAYEAAQQGKSWEELQQELQ